MRSWHTPRNAMSFQPTLGHNFRPMWVTVRSKLHRGSCSWICQCTSTELLVNEVWPKWSVLCVHKPIDELYNKEYFTRNFIMELCKWNKTSLNMVIGESDYIVSYDYQWSPMFKGLCQGAFISKILVRYSCYECITQKRNQMKCHCVFHFILNLHNF